MIEIPARELVRGDLIELEVGGLVPADLRLLDTEDLSVDESSLTGESVPVVKDPGGPAYMGTPVVSGDATGIVVATGRHTTLGRTAAILTREPVETEFHRSIRRFSDFLVRVILVLAAFVFLANAVLGRGWFDSLLFAVALAVGITPEVLPVIITITLASGALRMAREKVVAKRLSSVEDLGNVDVLCCDKTGTLSRGEFALRDHVGADGTRNPSVLLYGALAGTAGTGDPMPASNPTDQAIWSSQTLEEHRAELSEHRVLGRKAFGFNRRRASVLIEHQQVRALVVKGAVESVLPACARVQRGETTLPLTQPDRQELLTRAASYEADGLRTLAVALKETTAALISQVEESELVLLGFLLFLDSPKPEAREALEQLARLGVVVKVMSGDSPAVTQRICREVGLPIAEERVVTGADLATLSTADIHEHAGRYNAFARVTPEQKYQLVSAIRAQGHVVGFLGDGVNDVAALRAADVGISVDSGTEVAKEAADIILLQKSLKVLADGIVAGRRTFANITKYILNTISANFGNMSTVALSSALLRFIPLLPSQILLTNLLSDGPLVTIATDNVDSDLLQRPRRWNIPAIARFMVGFGLLSAIFDVILIVALLEVYRAGMPLFRTAWFLESACSEMLVTFAIRTRVQFHRSRPSRWLLWSSAAGAGVAFGLPFTRLGQHYFQFVPLPLAVVVLILGVLGMYFLSAEVAKRHFFRHFDW
jgi:Mg2+-importing ATPase